MEQQKQYVGIDLHRRRSVIVRRTEAGETLETVRIDNDPLALASELAKAGEHPEVVIEADLRLVLGRRRHSKSAEASCTWLIRSGTTGGTGGSRTTNVTPPIWSICLRLGRLAEGWVAPPALRELRELIRYRAKLVHLRSNLKAQIHAVLAKEGVAVPMTDLFGIKRTASCLDGVSLADAYRIRVESLRDLIELVDREITMRRRADRSHLRRRPRLPGRPGHPRRRPGAGRRSSWPRSATSRGSRALGTCAAGPG